MSMVTLVDSCVLIDILENDSAWSAWSEAQLAIAGKKGALATNAIIHAEIAKSFSTASDVEQFAQDFALQLHALSPQCAWLASRAHMAYRANTGKSEHALPDFFIGAQAMAHGWSVLTRDRKRFSTYFPTVSLITPD